MAIKIFLRPFTFDCARARVRNDGDIVAALTLANATPLFFRKYLLFIFLPPAENQPRGNEEREDFF
jgi:hypothetical protein